MATGLEALGAASAILSVISFAGNIISLSYKIYDGLPTPGDELGDYAKQMHDAADRVRIRNEKVPHGTSAEAKLSEVARKCIEVAGNLERETRIINRSSQKGKVFSSIYMAFRAKRQKAKIMELDESLKKCKQAMEMELLLQICDKGAAIEQQQSQGFQDLDNDVQNLISQLARGQTKIEMLVSQEAKKTRDAINTSLATGFKALNARAISDDQRQRLLKSLKSEEIRLRYDRVTSSSDACFERVFASYERVCCKNPEHKAWHTIEKAPYIVTDGGVSGGEVDEIDRLWDSFSSWLQSDDKLFWIRGKPGSGKSTLIKFIINNENTKRLLRSWSPNTQLLSHFFWKIGEESQNSIRGLLCSLLYHILSDCPGAIDQVLEQFSFSTVKDFYKEWPAEEAEEVLFSLLRTQTRSTCLFIDGLDEISNQDGFSALIDVIRKLRSIPKVKICVSSRPETELVYRLEAMGAQNLRLDHLTQPEMAVYIHKEFEKFSQGQISASLLREFTATLLSKAEGVFLWLVLATRSLTNGINNGDNEKTLRDRLQELPEELEPLYEAMWLRLNGNNKVYRETAAKYFRCMISHGWRVGGTRKEEKRLWAEVHVPNLAQLSLVMQAEDHEIFPPIANDETLAKLKALCDMTADDIQTRCAGMLQVYEKSVLHDRSFIDEPHFPSGIYPFIRQVGFIHRTAHDFLMDTEAGQSILNYKYDVTSSIDLQIKLVKSWLYLLIPYHTIGVIESVHGAVRECTRLKDKGADQGVILELLPVIQDLYKKGILGDRRVNDYPTATLPALLAYYFPSFEDFFISCFVQPNSHQVATDGLRDIAVESIVPGEGRSPPAQLIQKLITFGADSHAIGRSSLSLEMSQKGSPVTQQNSAFELFLRGAMGLFLQDYHKALPAFLDIIDTMAPTCPDWHRKVMIAARVIYRDNYSRAVLAGWELFVPYYDDKHLPWVAFEVDMQFLLTRFLAAVDLCKMSTQAFKLHELARSFTKPYVRIRHIGPGQILDQNFFCYRILDQQPFQGLVNHFFGPKDSANMTIPDSLAVLEDSLNSSPNSRSEPLSVSYEKVSFYAEIDTLAQEGVGLYRPADLGIVTPPLETLAA
ncbi:hypothetical protein FSARC_2454 [Fusarium sarcochroum]|uniref:NACHT domain-containing protein n=1 Tax=Fusarium sarcochroum TaxID=1208366 RepID=A0A8H4U647_9HYPO|nr:hypothetical protein FSARC_2454 [Fusarium sarcochroum]